MELTHRDYKYIKNTKPRISDILKKLPKYGTGTVPASIYDSVFLNWLKSTAELQGYLSGLEDSKKKDDYSIYQDLMNSSKNGKDDITEKPKPQTDMESAADRLLKFSTSTLTGENGTKNGYKWQDSIQNSLPLVGNFVGNIVKSYQFDDTENDLLGRTHTDSGSVGGIKYKLNSYVGKDYLDEVDNESWANIAKSTVSGFSLGMDTANNISTASAASGAMSGAGAAAGGSGSGGGIGDAIGLGAIVGGAGFLGSLWSLPWRSGKAEELRNTTNRYISRINNFNQNYALSTAKLQDYYKLHGVGTSLMLKGAEEGSDPRINPITNETVGTYLLDTAHGMAIGHANSKVKENEKMVDMNEAVGGNIPYIHTVRRGPNDNALAYTSPSTAIFSDDKINPETGNTIAEDVEDYARQGRLWDLLNIMDSVPNKDKLMKAKNGKSIPRYDDGLKPWMANLPTVLVGLGQYIKGSKDEPHKVDTFAPNTFATRGLNDLYGLRISQYPAIENAYKLLANTMNNIGMSGGLSGGQKTLAKLAALKGTLRNIAQSILNTQMQNNAYRSDAAKTGLTVGNQEANRFTQAAQFNADYLAKSMASKYGIMNTGLYNMLAGLGQIYKDSEKRRMFDKTYKLYADDLLNSKDQIKALANQIALMQNYINLLSEV